jgi:hypothetical protein
MADILKIVILYSMNTQQTFQISESPTSDALIRQTRAHHVQLSMMADAKANMLLTISAVLITLVIPYLQDSNFRIPAIVLTGFSVITVILAAWSTMPKLKPSHIKSSENNLFNLLFFGDFAEMDYPEYEAKMINVISDPTLAYKVQIKEIYALGSFLQYRKYRYLRLGYISFISGIFFSGSIALIQSIF